jgi:hypothetical protein
MIFIGKTVLVLFATEKLVSYIPLIFLRNGPFHKNFGRNKACLTAVFSEQHLKTVSMFSCGFGSYRYIAGSAYHRSSFA